jgi:hypothetical protein
MCQMKKIAVVFAVVSLLPLGSAVAQDGSDFEYVLPAFAYHLVGVDENLWSSEVYISNPSSVPANVRLGEFMPGRMVIPVACLPPQGIPREVPPFTTIVWPARDVAFEMGCATEMVGGLTFVADRTVSIVSRMVNEKVEERPVEEGFIPGFGLEIPAPGADTATAPGERLMLPALVWHPNACADPTFETSIGFVNLEDRRVTITLSFPGEDRPDYVFINHRPVSDRMEISVRARGWKQVTFGPPLGDGPEECKPAEVFDLVVDPDGAVIGYGTVVDRSTQDGRLVIPVPITEESAGIVD